MWAVKNGLINVEFWVRNRYKLTCISHERISIEILKTTSVVVVRQRGYEERWKCWLSRIWRFGRVGTKPSLTGREGVVYNREFLGNSGTTWSVPRDLTSRSFFSHQQTTSADILDIERRRQELRELESTTAIIRRTAFASLPLALPQ